MQTARGRNEVPVPARPPKKLAADFFSELTYQALAGSSLAKISARRGARPICSVRACARAVVSAL
ncbi:hypothetical protein, partial [Nocardia carnea]|uniref:hypothetical protein n=1 Tax=Nocardia carnea TaxID=37328 RepID=UPI002456BF20